VRHQEPPPAARTTLDAARVLPRDTDDRRDADNASHFAVCRGGGTIVLTVGITRPLWPTRPREPMGAAFSQQVCCSTSTAGRRESRVLVLGLDGAGKTTTLRKVQQLVGQTPGENGLLRGGEQRSDHLSPAQWAQQHPHHVTRTAPTLSFNHERLRWAGKRLEVWDVGGQRELRQLWRHYYDDVACLVFVIDSSDHDRWAEARQCIADTLSAPQLKQTPVLLLANKQDLPQAASADRLAAYLQVDATLCGRDWQLLPTSAVSPVHQSGMAPAFDFVARLSGGGGGGSGGGGGRSRRHARVREVAPPRGHHHSSAGHLPSDERYLDGAPFAG
jgi:GTPase SAR1 family protein